ncbi:unnamed protein product [Moneuplotes crassus]|uniref:FYVE-type domain-containing protein n=1 Tax=Euplotes crassus TaxID=5936 RepID=A0AAD1Y8U5_EUPCR|nr:unnamed protein product [Moneuplotes crassus]
MESQKVKSTHKSYKAFSKSHRKSNHPTQVPSYKKSSSNKHKKCLGSRFVDDYFDKIFEQDSGMNLKRINLDHLKTKLTPRESLFSKKNEIAQNNESIDETYCPSMVSDLEEKNRKSQTAGLKLCFNCDKKFTFFNKKSCKLCKHYFCSKCVKKITSEKYGKIRVCDNCQNMHAKLEKVRNKRKELDDKEKSKQLERWQGEFVEKSEERISNLAKSNSFDRNLIMSQSIESYDAKISNNEFEYQDKETSGVGFKTLDYANSANNNRKSEFLISETQPASQRERGLFQGLTMRKVTHDVDMKKKTPTKALPKKPAKKLNHQLLKEYESHQNYIDEFPSIESRIPKESYIEGITELNDIESCPEATNRYLEEKYLSRKFLKSDISELTRPENEFISGLRFEFIINKILYSNSVRHKWYYPIHSFVDKITRTIKPPKHLPNELVQFKDFVTIKKVKWSNHLKCEYISGMVLQNYIADRRMRQNILNPQIILVEGDLTFEKNRKNCIDIDSIMKQDKTYGKIIEKIINRAKPDILVFEGSVSRKIVEIIRDCGCTLVMNVGKLDMQSLSYLTNADIIPSIEFLNEDFKKGTCEEFIVQDQMGGKRYPKNASSYLQSLVIFKGCDPSLGCTVTFSGMDTDELDLIEKVFERVLVACRQYKLEMEFERKQYASMMHKTYVLKEGMSQNMSQLIYESVVI